MGDNAAARDRIADRGIPMPAGNPTIRAVLVAWAAGFIGVLLPEGVRRWRRERRPVGARQVALYAGRRVTLTIVTFVLADRVLRASARAAIEADELRDVA